MTAMTPRTKRASRSANTFANRQRDVSGKSREVRSFALGLLGCRNEHFFDVLPVHQVIEERLEIVGPPIAIIDIIGMLPHVAAENWRCTVNKRVFAIRRLADDQFSVLDREPRPACAKLRYASLR